MKWYKLLWLTIYRLIKMEKEVVVFDESTSIYLDDVVWVSIAEYYKFTEETDEFGRIISKSEPIILISAGGYKYEFPYKPPYIEPAAKCQSRLNKNKPKMK